MEWKAENARTALIADLLLVLVALVWGINFVVVKSLLGRLTPLYYLGFRFILAGSFLFLLFPRRIAGLRRQDVARGAFVGMFLCLGFIAQTVGLQFTTPGKSAFITSTYVVVVPLLQYFFAKNFAGRHVVAGAFVIVIGTGLLSWDQALGRLGTGEMLTVLCAMLFALHLITLGIFAPSIDPVGLTAVQIGITGVACILAAALLEPFPGMLPALAWLGVAFGAVFATIGAFLTQTTAQRFTQPSRAGIILSLESFFAMLFSYLFWQETLSARVLAGCVLILAGVLVTESSHFTGKKAGLQNSAAPSGE